MDLVSIVESLLFASQEPLTAAQMVTAIRDTAKDVQQSHEGAPEPAPDWVSDHLTTDEQQVNGAIHTLIGHYETDQRAFTLVERSSGWRICARAEFAEWCRALYPGKKPQRLSQPALETLAIIAYRQPITRAGVEAVRGVSVDSMVQQLMDRQLIKIEGRADLPGRPLLYGTTDAFLDHFGVRALDELPNAAELRRVKLPSAEEADTTTASDQSQQLALETPDEAGSTPRSRAKKQTEPPPTAVAELSPPAPETPSADSERPAQGA